MDQAASSTEARGIGSRTAESGSRAWSHRWFVRWIALAVLIWALYAALLGYVGGRAFQHDHTKAFLAALIIGVAATLLIEVVRRRFERRALASNGGRGGDDDRRDMDRSAPKP